MATPYFEFGPFRLDPVERLLLRDGVEVRLTPKVFALLLTLVRHRGRLLDKDTLMRTLWPGQVVDEANLTQSVVMLRKSLDDRPTAPRYVETRARRGYRFIADVRERYPAFPDRPVPSAVGRVRELGELRAELAAAAAGGGRLVCVTGEPGIGKTTLVDRFLDQASAEGHGITVARGRCSQRLAGTGAYLPWLDALEDCLQQDLRGDLAGVMWRTAPSWLLRVAPPEADARSRAERPGPEATSQELMMRELLAFVQQASSRQPLVIWLDDLHWADGSTVDLLAYLATRLPRLRVLVLLAYRPSELLITAHPFLHVKQELEARGACREVALPFLSRGEVEEYLAHVFPGHRFPATVSERIHARTEGNPLFMVDLVGHLQERGVIARDAHAGVWTFDEAATEATRDLPASVRVLIERKISRLQAGDRALLAAASVQGEEFDSLVLARALGVDQPDVEERLGELERTHALVRWIGEELPGEAPTVRYRFAHVLYHDVIGASLPPSRRARLSGAIAVALLASRRAPGEIAPELAQLYESARQPEPAAAWYARPAEGAAELFAHREAAALARRGLRTLAGLPDRPRRARLELRLQAALGVALSITSGYAAADTGASLTRAYELCRQADGAPQLFPAVWRLWVYSAAGAESRRAMMLARRLLAMARRSRDPSQLVAAHFAMGNTLHLLGQPVPGSRHLDQGVARHDLRRCRVPLAFYGCDPGLYCRSHSARALWLLGYPDRARRRSDETLALARAVGDPRSVAHVLMFAAICHQLRREPDVAAAHAATCVAMGDTHGMADEARRGAVLLGWASAASGRPEEGIPRIRESLEVLRAMRSINTLPYYLALLADALGRASRPDEALAVADEGLAEVRRTGERFYEAELHRLRGEFLLQARARDARGRAEAAFRRALTVARAQAARSLELRAATSLARAAGSGRAALARVHRWFTEGFETPDLREARALLERQAPAGSRRVYRDV